MTEQQLKRGNEINKRLEYIRDREICFIDEAKKKIWLPETFIDLKVRPKGYCGNGFEFDPEQLNEEMKKCISLLLDSRKFDLQEERRKLVQEFESL